MAKIQKVKKESNTVRNKEKLTNKIAKRIEKEKARKIAKFKDCDISTLGCTIRKLFKMNNLRKQEIIDYERSPKHKHRKRKNV